MRSPSRALLLTSFLLFTLTWRVPAQQAAGAAPTPAAPALAPPGTADLGGLPPLPALGNDPRHDSLRDADRLEVAPTRAQRDTFSVPGTEPIDDVLNKIHTGTGFAEPYTYQVPPGYDPDGPPAPLLIAYHGFGSSAASVSAQTLLDELCALRGWFYLAPTGVDDKLFGTQVAQQNVDALLRLMLKQYSIDPDRIYMVGFSMGAGVTANYAATHRDPDDIMIAAVGLVSGAYDWAMTYTMDPAVQPWMLNVYNFGAAPDGDLFAYQRASGLFHDLASYPPIPGVLDAQQSFAWNLEDVPAWVSWDTGDTITYLPDQSEHFVALMSARGGEVVDVPVSGTTNPLDGKAAPHSWAVMDPFSLFDFLDGREVERRPEQLDVMLDEDATISFVEAGQVAPGAFTRLVASLDKGAGSIALEHGENLARVRIDVATAGLADAWPVTVDVTAAEAHDLQLTIEDGAALPGYMLDASSGQLVSGSEWDALAGTLTVSVPSFSTVHYLAQEAPWGISLGMSPDPVATGADFSVRVKAASGPATLWMILSTQEGLLPVGPDLMLAVPPFPPAVLHPLSLDGDGELELTVTMPADPGLSGLRLSFQGALLTPGGWVTDTTNPFGLDIL